jgi:histone deacetylase complex regulatory component SIN3
MSEEEVFTEVANLFRGQEDLLSEFGQFLPEAKRSLVSAKCPGSCPKDMYRARVC